MNENSYIKLSRTSVDAMCLKKKKTIESERCKNLTAEYNEYVDTYNKGWGVRFFKKPKLEHCNITEFVPLKELPEPVRKYIIAGYEGCINIRYTTYYAYGRQYALMDKIINMCKVEGCADDHILLSRDDYGSIFE